MIRKIRISELEVEANIGCLPEEREKSSRLIIVIELSLADDFGTSEACDRLDRTIDYRKITGEVKKIIAARHYKMLESLAENCACALFDLSAKIILSEVAITKPDVDIGGGIPQITASYKG